KSTPAHPLNAKEAYHAYLTHAFAHLKDFPYKIALDFGNGVGAIGLEPVLRALNIKFDSLYPNPDGTFPNHHPDPSEAKNLKDLQVHMQVHQIPIGIAFDGDADRVALLTPDHIYAGDELAILFAKNLAKKGIKPLVIGEVKCSQVMYNAINTIGQAIMYKTGHSNLKVKLKETNAHFAAEMSGHLFFNDRYFGYDDALYACLRLLELFLEQTPIALEASLKTLPYSYKTPEEKIAVKEEEKFKIIDKLKVSLKRQLPPHFPPIVDLIDIDGIRVVFKDGFALVRASNTTPTLVTRFEGKNEKSAQRYKQAVLGLLGL
ncbi:phosphomannomutase/phosphoglucomutase, partial [Helicobacter heilmannii]|uniref:phosphomannomutase/phosphoglucomutase n=1 Tax=Helicobacter heilmannii TaxID=35817 RepID=UPI0006B343C7